MLLPFFSPLSLSSLPLPSLLPILFLYLSFPPLFLNRGCRERLDWEWELTQRDLGTEPWAQTQYGVLSSRISELLVENSDFFMPPPPALGGARRSTVIQFGTEN